MCWQVGVWFCEQGGSHPELMVRRTCLGWKMDKWGLGGRRGDSLLRWDRMSCLKAQLQIRRKGQREMAMNKDSTEFGCVLNGGWGSEG